MKKITLILIAILATLASLQATAPTKVRRTLSGDAFAGGYTLKIFEDSEGSDLSTSLASLRSVDVGFITKVIIMPPSGNRKIIAPPDISYLFANFHVTTEIQGLEHIDVSQVEDMEGIFENCCDITSLDLSSWNTSSITNLSNAFRDCHELTSLNVSNWDVSNVDSLEFAFEMTRKLLSLDLSSWETPKLKNADCLFKYSSITYLDISSFNTENVIYSDRFNSDPFNDVSLDTIKLGQKVVGKILSKIIPPKGGVYAFPPKWVRTSDNQEFDTIPQQRGTQPETFIAKRSDIVTTKLSATISDTTIIIQEDPNGLALKAAVEKALTENNVTGIRKIIIKPLANGKSIIPEGNLRYLFYPGDYRLSKVHTIEGLEHIDVSKVWNFYQTFCNLSVDSLDLSTWTFSSAENVDRMFYNCKDLNFLDISSFNSAYFKTSIEMFGQVKNIRKVIIGDNLPQRISNQIRTYNEGDYSGKWQRLEDGEIFNLCIPDNDTVAEPGTYIAKIRYSLHTASINNNILTVSPDINGKTLKEAINAVVNNSNRPTIQQIIIEPMPSGEKIVPRDDLSYLFGAATAPTSYSSLTSITGLSHIDVSKVTSTEGAFKLCSKIEHIDLSGWQLNSLETSNSMFFLCRELESINTEGASFTLGADAASMFFYTSLKSLDLSTWDLSGVQKATSMFEGNQALASIQHNNWNFTSLTYTRKMFYGCKSLQSLDLSTWDISKVENMSEMFRNCINLRELNLENWNTDSLSNCTNAFNAVDSLEQIFVGNKTNSELTDQILPSKSLQFTQPAKWVEGSTQSSFSQIPTAGNYARQGSYFVKPIYTLLQASLSDSVLTISEDPTGLSLHSAIKREVRGANTMKVKKVIIEPLQNGEKIIPEINLSNLFSDPALDNLYRNLDTIIGLEHIDVSKVCNFNSMFRSCYKLRYVDLSSWNVQNVHYIEAMFSSCEELQNLDLSTWEISKATSFENMFSGCNKLQHLDLSSFNVDNTISFNSMFKNCRSLESLNIDNWNTANITNFNNMFFNVTSLKTVTVGNALTENISDIITPTKGGIYTEQGKWIKLENWIVYDKIPTTGGLALGDTYIARKQETKFSTSFADSTFNLNVDENGVSLKLAIRHAVSEGIVEDIAHVVINNLDNNKIVPDLELNQLFYVTNFGTSFSNLRTITGLEHIDMSQVSTISYMFGTCHKLKKLNLSQWDLINTTHMSNIFFNSPQITFLDLSSWNTSKALIGCKTFHSCKSIDTIIIGNTLTNDIASSISIKENPDPDKGTYKWLRLEDNIQFDSIPLNVDYAQAGTYIAHFIPAPVSVDNIQDDNQARITIYPNPAKDIVHIHGINPEKVEVIDLHGRIVITEHNTTHINTSALTRGIYILKTTTNQQTQPTKLIIQ